MENEKMLAVAQTVENACHEVRGVAVALDALGMAEGAMLEDGAPDCVLMLAGRLHDIADSLNRAKDAM